MLGAQCQGLTVSSGLRSFLVGCGEKNGVSLNLYGSRTVVPQARCVV